MRNIGNKEKIKKLSEKNDNLNPYIKEAQMFDEISKVIDNYSGVISTVAAVGILELAKHQIIKTTIEED